MQNDRQLPLLSRCGYIVCSQTDVIIVFCFLVAPSVEVSNTTLIVQEGSNIYLNCNASGKPEPSITWTKVDSFEVLSNTSSLTIMNVSRPGTPDNMFQYQCTASNGVESPATATVNVTVHCKYNVQPEKTRSLKPFMVSKGIKIGV